MTNTITNLYNRYRPALLAFAASRCKSFSAAEDIVQQSFLKLLEKQESLPEINNWKSYLFILIRNETITWFRKQKLQGQLLTWQAMQQSHSTSHDALLEKEMRETLAAAFRRLPMQRRKVYQLSFECGYSNKEIAAELDLSVNTIKCHLQEARTVIRKCVERKLVA